MLIIRRGHRKQYVIGGSGIFESIPKFLMNLLTSSATKKLASTAADVVTSAAKSAATDATKSLMQKAARKIFSPKSKDILQKYTGERKQPVAIQNLAKKLNGSGMKVAR